MKKLTALVLLASFAIAGSAFAEGNPTLDSADPQGLQIMGPNNGCYPVGPNCEEGGRGGDHGHGHGGHGGHGGGHGGGGHGGGGHGGNH